jgi:hypothetical protein
MQAADITTGATTSSLAEDGLIVLWTTLALRCSKILGATITGSSFLLLYIR